MSFRPLLPAVLLAAALATAPAAAQGGGAAPGTLVIAVASEARQPVPLLWNNDQANRELSDLMFLRLADIGADLSTTDERHYLPRLARKWERRDSLTLVFELDPRARWQDNTPVTPADVIYALERGRDPRLSPQIATLLTRIASVTAEGSNKVVVRFREVYAHQFYDAVYHTPPLPAHLLTAIPPDSLATSAFVAAPVGNGPYRWSRRVPGQLIELTAWPAFFLGRPGIQRIILRVATSGEARANLLLSGEADALDQVDGLPDPARITSLPDFQFYPAPGLALVWAGFNQRDGVDTSRANPILSDRVVRRALTIAIDRQKLGASTYGRFSQAPSAPLSAIVGRQIDAPPPLPWDTAGARRLLASRGWVDHNGDGILDKDGAPFVLHMIVPSSVPTRVRVATQMQEAYRQLGIDLQVELVERSVFTARRDGGRFDMDIHTSLQDPAPDGLAQSWSCAGIGGSNKLHYCNPGTDSLMARAVISRKDAPRLWRETARRLADDAPAIFIAAVVGTTAIHRRFEHVVLRPESVWSQVWLWRVKPGAELARDRQ